MTLSDKHGAPEAAATKSRGRVVVPTTCPYCNEVFNPDYVFAVEECDRCGHSLGNFEKAMKWMLARVAKWYLKERDRRVWEALEAEWREDHVKQERKANREMSTNHLADKVHELRTRRESIRRQIDDYRAKGEVPPADLLADLRRVGNDLLVALDERSERK